MGSLFRKYAYLPVVLITILIFIRLFFLPVRNWGGDIAEYFGMSQSLMTHFTPELTTEDRLVLEEMIEPVNFRNPQYYIENYRDQRQPVHFFLYSVLLIPFRLILRFLGANEFLSFRFLNFSVFFLSCLYIFQKHIRDIVRKYIFIFLVILSPLMSFILWPGPDLMVISFLLVSVFEFYSKSYVKAAVLASIASWHSQPLIIIALIFSIFEIARLISGRKVCLNNIIKLIVVFLIAFIPYIYNLYIFGMFSPWPLIKDGWTVKYGFGLQNISPGKLFEQFFDLNIGIFFYYPIPLILGFWGIFKEKNILIKSVSLLIIIFTAFSFQTNPAFNYGTVGYGPTRHILFVMPFLIFFSLKIFRKNIKFLLITVLFFISQLYIFSFNGYLFPDLIKSLYHNPYASYILENYPDLYNPTPEIFIDRTNHTDLLEISGAIYKNKELCKKAYVYQNQDTIIKECGFLLKENNSPDRYGGYYITY